MDAFEVDTSHWEAYAAALSAVTGEVARVVPLAQVDAAQLLVSSARPTVPRVSGAAQGSMRVLHLDGATAAAAGGSGDVSYYAWLEYGGAAGRNHAVHRPKVAQGRYLHPALLREQVEIREIMVSGMGTALEMLSSF